MSDVDRAIRVLCVDDHPLFRRGVASVILDDPGMTLVGEAGSGQEAIDQVRALKPDVVLMDLRMPSLGGVEATSIIVSEYPGTRILVITTFQGDVEVLRALKAGAAGYIVKSAIAEDLCEAIRKIHKGNRYIPTEIAAGLAHHAGEPLLTPREVAVLQLVAAGKSNYVVAQELFVTEETVKSHMRNIMTKLGARDRTHAVIIGIQRGILVP